MIAIAGRYSAVNRSRHGRLALLLFKADPVRPKIATGRALMRPAPPPVDSMARLAKVRSEPHCPNRSTVW
jgi:hypothetical protein